jgi:hypothetical protein
MNILLIELGGSHIECTYTFAHLLAQRGHRIHLVCNHNLLEYFPEKDKLSGYKLYYDQFNFWQSLKTIFSIRNYVRKHKIERIIFNTTELKIIRNLFLIIPKRVKTFGVFHNAKKLESGGTVKKIFSKRMKKYFLLGEDLIAKTTLLKGLQAYAYFPVYFPPPAKIDLKKNTNEFWVTIVGAVNIERRDYLRLFELIQTKCFNKKIKFILLGRNNLPREQVGHFYDTDWWKSSIITFKETIPYDIFHNYILASDVILPLIKIEDDTMYGQQRISGSYNVGIGYKKPFILPSTVDNIDIQPYSIYYKNLAEMVSILNDISDKPELFADIQKRYSNCDCLDFISESERLSNYLELT